MTPCLVDRMNLGAIRSTVKVLICRLPTNMEDDAFWDRKKWYRVLQQQIMGARALDASTETSILKDITCARTTHMMLAPVTRAYENAARNAKLTT